MRKSSLPPGKPLTRKKGLERNPEKSLSRKQPLKVGRGFSASPAQQAKVKDMACLRCGLDRYEAKIDPHHLIPSCCDHPDAVVPLCRACHDWHHHGGSLLEYLWPQFTVELQHGLTHCSPVTQIQTVSKDTIIWKSLEAA